MPIDLNDAQKAVAELDAILEEPGPLPPIGHDGGFVPGAVMETEPIPDMTAENSPCLRSCRYYLEIVSRFQAGNTRGTLESPPKQINRFCLRSSDPVDLTDENVYKCNAWDPEDPAALSAVQKRRDEWKMGKE